MSGTAPVAAAPPARGLPGPTAAGSVPAGTGEPSNEASSAVPSPSAVEWRIAVSAVRFALALGLPLVVVATLVAGAEGALGATVAMVIVCGMFAIPAVLVSAGARYGVQGIIAATLGGFQLRLVLFGGLLIVLTHLRALHGASLPLVAAGILVPTLIYESWVVCRAPGYFWVDSTRALPRSGGSATRPSERTAL